MARSQVFSFRRWLSSLGLICAVSAGCAGTKVAQNETPGQFPAAPPSHANTAVNYSEANSILLEDTTPDKASAQLHLAYGQLQEQRGDAAAARVSYLKAIETDAKCVEAHVGLCRLDLAVGRRQEGEEHLREALKQNPNSAFGLAAMGQFYGDQGRWDQALDFYGQAMNAAPDDKRYAFQLAVALAKAGRVEESRPLFGRSVGEAAGHHNVAVILKEQGNFAGAQVEAQYALAKDPALTASRELLLSLGEVSQAQVTHANGPAIRPGAPQNRSAAHARSELQQVSGIRSVHTSANAPAININEKPAKKAEDNWDIPAIDDPDGEWQKMPTAPRGR